MTWLGNRPLPDNSDPEHFVLGSTLLNDSVITRRKFESNQWIPSVDTFRTFLAANSESSALTNSLPV
jgi:hypothetical protein